MAEITKQQTDAAPSGNGNGGQADAAFDQIRDALRGLRFGLVSIIVQDGIVIQIERTERKRLR